MLDQGPHPIALFALSLIGLAASINVTRLVAPRWVPVGGDTTLDCQYRLEGETLYSIKWYQGDREIYRYTPSKSRPVQVFPNDFLTVDIGKSSAGLVLISNVSAGADGPFRCEVSAEAPTFYTDYGVVQLRVIALPQGGPVILGTQPRHNPGDWVALTCVTRMVRPAPTLSFLVNDEPPKPGWVEPQETHSLPEGLYSASLRMRFFLKEQLLRGPYRDETRVRCRARIPELYEAATEEVLTTRLERPQASVLGGPTAEASSVTQRSQGLVIVCPLMAWVVAGRYVSRAR